MVTSHYNPESVDFIVVVDPATRAIVRCFIDWRSVRSCGMDADESSQNDQQTWTNLIARYWPVKSKT